MGNARDTCNEINSITAKLIELGICDDQKFACYKEVGSDLTEVSFDASSNFSLILKNVPYNFLYTELRQFRDYNMALADGALIQLQYLFKGEDVLRHRLAFLPSPDLTEYQNDPELYESDMIFAEVLAKNIVTTPVRFDFDKESSVPVDHPIAHLTIGQYKNCRIPVSSAVSPFRFMEFILGSFYNTAYRDFCSKLDSSNTVYPATITKREADKIHIRVCK